MRIKKELRKTEADQTSLATLITSDNHNKTISFFTFTSPDTPFIIGFPWLQKHNPHIDWARKTIASWSLFFVSLTALRSAVPINTGFSFPQISQPPDLSWVPSEYHVSCLSSCRSRHLRTASPISFSQFLRLLRYPCVSSYFCPISSVIKYCI